MRDGNKSGFTACCLSALLYFTALPMPAADLNRGKILYEDHCTGCHNESVFQRKKRMVNTEQQLLARIRQCELSNELTWFDEDIQDVAAYIGQTFYGFQAHSSE